MHTDSPRVSLGASYEGRDPELLGRMLPHVDYIEVTLETIAEIENGSVSLNEEVMSEIINIGGGTQIIVHGVSLSIGSHEGWASTYLHLLDAFLDRVDVAWHSEHLGYTKVDGEHLGIMLAMPRTEYALDMVCERVCAIQDRYGMPFLLENIVHVLPDFPGEYSNAAFLNELTARTGCGLLVDVYNLQCDAHNHGLDVSAFLAELDFTKVREIHVACGVEHDGLLLDVHSQLTRDSTVELAREVIKQARGRAQVVVFEFMPEAVPALGHKAIEEELAHLRACFQS